jgi:hypothetical protein
VIRELEAQHKAARRSLRQVFVFFVAFAPERGLRPSGH